MANFTLFRAWAQPTSRVRLLGLLAGTALLLGARPSQAQDVSAYTFAASSGTFTPITGGTAVPNLSANDAISANISLPFTFVYGGRSITTFQATTDGYIDLRGSSTYSQSINMLGAGLTTIAPFYDDLTGANGQASYVTTGTAPSRVFTFQWLNWADGYAATAADLSFQVKFYETSNIVQFVYRQEGTAFTSTASASIGLDGGSVATGSRGNFVSLLDASASPMVVNTATTTTAYNNISTRPATGQVYTFTPSASLATHAALGVGSLEVFPNPAQRACTLNLPALATPERVAQLTLFNSLGQLVQARTLALEAAGTQAQLDLGGLAAGLYTLRVQAGGQVATRQLAVQ